MWVIIGLNQRVSQAFLTALEGFDGQTSALHICARLSLLLLLLPLGLRWVPEPRKSLQAVHFTH